MNLNTANIDVSQNTVRLAEECIKELESIWADVEKLVFFNQIKVLKAFNEERISLAHMWPSTGYGYQDTGRDGLERVFARSFGAQSALVRLSWTSGTHVLKTVLFGLLRPGDHLLSITGTPYETLRPVIGIGHSCEPGSLKDFGVEYSETDCMLNYEIGRISKKTLEAELANYITPKTKVVMIQRSRGYASRKTISMSSISDLTTLVHGKWPSIAVFVDNCYCEFAEIQEPPEVGVNITAGSLIKNPGGGLAATGGYTAGTEKHVELVANSLYATGLGKEAGSNPYGYRDVYQGFFLAPKIVGEALKGASFAALFFDRLGYKVDPGPFEKRRDIVQEITLGQPGKLRAFARAIQAASPVDSFAAPEPWEMPGYAHDVIMAAGAFVQGASIELSCDGPFIPPYTAYLQGGLTKEHVIYACMKAKEALS